MDELFAFEDAEVVMTVLTMEPEEPMLEVALLRKMGVKVHRLDGSTILANHFSE